MIRDGGEDCRGLAAAYREGLGLAAIAVICERTGPRIFAAAAGGDDALAAAQGAHARWWCRRAADAERIAAAAARIRRRKSSAAARGQAEDSASLSHACAAVLVAAKRFDVALQSDDEIVDEAMRVAARIDAEMQKQQQAGALRSVNKAYRCYRLESSGRGERVLRYDEWMRKYRENLVRQVALTLRQI